jgi:hypothetical protein
MKKKKQNKKNGEVLAKLTIGKKKSKKYGRIMRLEYQDGVELYLTKRGLNICVPKSGNLYKDNIVSDSEYFQMNFSPEELDVFVQAMQKFVNEIEGKKSDKKK